MKVKHFNVVVVTGDPWRSRALVGGMYEREFPPGYFDESHKLETKIKYKKSLPDNTVEIIEYHYLSVGEILNQHALYGLPVFRSYIDDTAMRAGSDVISKVVDELSISDLPPLVDIYEE